MQWVLGVGEEPPWRGNAEVQRPAVRGCLPPVPGTTPSVPQLWFPHGPLSTLLQGPQGGSCSWSRGGGVLVTGGGQGPDSLNVQQS